MITVGFLCIVAVRVGQISGSVIFPQQRTDFKRSTHFKLIQHFCTSWIHHKTRSLLMFSGGVEIELWPEMGLGKLLVIICKYILLIRKSQEVPWIFPYLPILCLRSHRATLYSECFWSVLSRICTKYGIRRFTLQISVLSPIAGKWGPQYGYFLRNECSA